MSGSGNNRRAFDRSRFVVGCTCTLATGEIVSGETADISPRGVGVGGPLGGRCEIGAEGVLRLNLTGFSDRAFSCIVIHHSSGTVGLQIKNPRDNLGLVVTQAVLGDINVRMGVDGTQWTGFDVFIKGMGGVPLPVSIEKLTVRNAEFSFSSSVQRATWLQRDLRIEVIVRLRGSEVRVFGVVTEPPFSRRDRFGMISIVRVLFHNSVDGSSNRLAELIRGAHEKRLTVLLQNRALAHVERFDDPLHRFGREKIRRDMDRFLPQKRK
ncbi:MAG: PilZ domain-containing protein [Magnetococcales bacterium]|nr:PilZ domain-containing protein [Magnetococcales bacterium]